MKNIYITWHYTTHGIAYLKHILSSFYLLKTLPSEILHLNNMEQEELNTTFDNLIENGMVFNEVVYLTAPQKAFDSISSRRVSYRKSILQDKYVEAQNLTQVFNEVISKDVICNNIESQFEFVKMTYPHKFEDFKSAVWRNIQHFPIDQQIKWLTEYSNFKNIYDGKFKVVELKIDDLRDEKQISEEVHRWSLNYFSDKKDYQPIVNVSLGSNETQVVWHILSEAGQLPDNTRFIKTYDDKSDRSEKSFKKFSIKEIPTNLISKIGTGFYLFRDTQSPLRKLVEQKMTKFLESGFSILLMGERGIGKSNIVSNVNENKQVKVKVVEANCASFDDDNTAEAELFGVMKGTFTGVAERKGLFHEANGGILFLDEIHHLSPLIQAKLMKAIQTDKNNKMRIKKLGSISEIEVECRLIFATNKSISELRTLLLPDFFDRIVQHVINIPSLRDTKEDRLKDFEKVWEHLKFDKKQYPKELNFFNWIKSLQLYGNYRDLQKIAIYYNTFNQFDSEIIKMINQKTAYQYAKTEFEKYHSPFVQIENKKFNFNFNQTTKEMIADYLFELQKWAVENIHGGRKGAIEHFQLKGDTITDKTLNNWKNKKSLKTQD